MSTRSLPPTPAYVLRRIGFYVLICAITLFFAVPMLWIASAPFDASPGLGVHWPDWTLENFRKTLEHPYAMHSMVNSLLICVTTAVAVTRFAVGGSLVARKVCANASGAPLLIAYASTS